MFWYIFQTPIKDVKHVVKKYIQENIKEKIVEIIYILLYSFILYVCLESIKYKNVLYVIYLIFNIGAYQYILVSILIVFSFLLFIRSISKNLTMSHASLGKPFNREIRA